jgi:plastocyanin
MKTLALSTAAVALAIAGCGSSNDNSSKSTSSSAASKPPPTTPAPSSAPSGGKSSSVKLAADPSGALKFDKTSASAKAGSVTLTMNNPSSVPHGISVEGNGVDKAGQVVNKGGTSTVTAKLKPGKYLYYCPVPGHKQAGMTGNLTVK